MRSAAAKDLPLRQVFALAADVTAPRTARRLVAEALEGRLDDELIDTVLLLISEILTRAVVQAGTETVMELSHDTDGVVVRVHDRHPGRSAALEKTTLADASEAGRGLALVDALASAWGTEHSPHGTAVWFELGDSSRRRPPVPTSPAPMATHPRRRTSTLVSEKMLPLLAPASEVGELLARVLDVLPASAGVVSGSEGDLLATVGVPDAGQAPLRLPLDAGDRVVGELQLWPATLELAEQERSWVGLVTCRMALTLRLGQLRVTEKRHTGMLAFLAEASELLAGTMDVPQTLALLAQLPVPRFARWAAVHVVAERDTPTLAAAAHAVEEAGADLRGRITTEAGAVDGAVRAVLRTGRTARTTLGGDVAFVAPLCARRRVLGALTLGRPADQAFYGDEIDLLEGLARRAALAIDNAQLFAQQVEAARALQRGLLPPDLPTVDGLDFGAAYRAARTGLEVGGDFFDVTSAGDGSWALSIGDVCGKGADAAAVTGVARDLLRRLVREGRRLPQALVELNHTLRDHGDDVRFCTVATARLSRTAERSAVLSVCLAGHPPPVLLRRDGDASLVGTPGTLLGALGDHELVFEEVSVELHLGDAVVFYTDGVTETRASGAMFGDSGLLRAVRSCAGLPAQAIAHRLQAAAAGFAGDDLGDDLAVLVVRICP